jgi:hypothetical protein
MMTVVEQATAEIRLPELPPAMMQRARDAIRAELAVHAWAWFDAHREDVVLERRVWFVPLVVRVRDLGPVFAILFGPRPDLPEVRW